MGFSFVSLAKSLNLLCLFCAQPGPVAAVFLTHWADLGSWELAQRLSKALLSLQAGCALQYPFEQPETNQSSLRLAAYAGVCRSLAWAWAALSRGAALRSCWTSQQTCCTLVCRAF